MRIDNFQNIPAILESLKVSGSSKTSLGRNEKNPSSSVTLSSFAETVKVFQRQAAQGEKSRAARVAELSLQEKSGTLKVDVSKLAEKLVDLNVMNLRK